MNKKQLTFYAFMLTFGIACDDGSVETSEGTISEDTTLTKDNNAHKEDNVKGDKPIKNNGKMSKFKLGDAVWCKYQDSGDYLSGRIWDLSMYSK